MIDHPVTPDGCYFVVLGRLWRLTDLAWTRRRSTLGWFRN